MRHSKKLLSRLLGLFLLLTTLTLPALAAQGAENSGSGNTFQYTDSYVLSLGKNSYAYFSPFTPLLTYDGNEVSGYSILFQLKNTYTGEIMENAYCTDMPVDAQDNFNYQRLNLTDSTYAATHANKLRAIVLGSYPYLSLEDLRTATGLDTLSICEAITGTQLAIWKAAHGDIVEIKDFLYTASAGYSSIHDTSEERNAYIDGSEEHKAQVKSNIESLYYYLMCLEERPAISTTISSASFVSRTAPTLANNGDGTYDVTVRTTLSVSGGDLTLTASMADGRYYTQISGVGSGEYTLTIKNVPEQYASGTVTLSLDGIQSVNKDVFLLDAEGIRGVSQSLIAPMSGSLPVHAEIKCEPNRMLKLYKTADGEPLANISFEIYYVASLEDFLNGKLSIGSSPTQSDIDTYATTNRLVGTITTDANGYGEMDFSTADGVYLVNELPNDLVTTTVSFFICLPDYSNCDENGNPAYTITTSAKNTLHKEKVEIEKDVTRLDNEHDTYDIGENHTWIIQSSIPYGIGVGKQYTVSDTLDSRLTLVSVDRVSLAKDSGTFGNSEAEGYVKDEDETPLGEESLVLTKDTDYVLTTSRTDAGSDAFTVSLTEAGRRKIAEITEKQEGYELRIAYTAFINSTAGMGEKIPNQAHVVYTNNLGRSYSSDSDQPEVHTGGIQLLKTDKNGQMLSGAVFQVYRKADQEEVAAGNYNETIQIGGTEYKMVLASFHGTSDCSGEKVTSLTTDTKGLGYIYGLAYGDYYLAETQAPAGYNALREPVAFTIDATSHLSENQVEVINTSGAELPSTGGMGTLPFTLSGLTLICTAAWLLRRKLA